MIRTSPRSHSLPSLRIPSRAFPLLLDVPAIPVAPLHSGCVDGHGPEDLGLVRLDAHPRALELISKEMSAGDPETAAVLDAQQEMTKAVHCVRLANWQQVQQSEEKCSWKDFVLPDVMRTAKKEDANRQMYVTCVLVKFLCGC